MRVNFANAHDVRMPLRSRTVALTPVGRGAPIGYAIRIEVVRASSVLLKEEET